MTNKLTPLFNMRKELEFTLENNNLSDYHEYYRWGVLGNRLTIPQVEIILKSYANYLDLLEQVIPEYSNPGLLVVEISKIRYMIDLLDKSFQK